MLIKMIPQLENGYILKRSMLMALADAAFLTSEYLCKDYADGVLAGCELTTNEDTIVVNEGIVFFDGQVFLIKEPLRIHYEPTNTTTVLKLCFSNETRDADCIYWEMDAILTDQVKLQKGELELCRFKLQEGARLRYQYQGFEDRNTEFDTLNMVHVPYAAKGCSTLSPDITKSFAREMLELENISDFDALFCLQVLGQDRAVTKEALKGYIEHRKKEKITDDSNLGIYQELVKILQQEKGTAKPDQTQKIKKWKIRVD